MTRANPASRRALLRWIALAAVAPIASACAAAAPPTPTAAPRPEGTRPAAPAPEATKPAAAAQAAPTTAPAKAGPAVKIKINNLIEPPNPAYNDVAKTFNDANAGKIEAELQVATGKDWKTNLLTAIAAGSPPDADIRLQVGWIGEFGSAGWLLSLDKYLAESAFAKDIPANVMDEGRLKPGTPVLIVPAEGFVSILYYNKAILNKAGLKPPTTLEEFRAAVAATARPQENIWGYALRGGANGNQMWEPYLFANGGDWFDQNNDKILIDQEPAIQAAQQDIDFFKKKYVRPEALTDEWAQLVQGMTTKSMAMLNHGVHVRKPIADALGPDLGYAPIPKGAREGTWKNFNGPGLLKGAKQPDAAWEYVAWYMKPEWRKTLTIDAPDERIPTTRVLLEDPKVKSDEAFKISMNALFNAYGRSPNWHPRYGQVIGAEFHVGKQKAMLGEITAKQQMERLRDVLLGTLKAGG
jgi:multiple sugar transport system substrate-binding protein